MVVFAGVPTAEQSFRHTFRVSGTSFVYDGQPLQVLSGLGRFWNIGPQQTLFLPAPFMKQGRNDVVVLDLFDAPATPTLSGLKDPILNEVKR